MHQRQWVKVGVATLDEALVAFTEHVDRLGDRHRDPSGRGGRGAPGARAVGAPASGSCRRTPSAGTEFSPPMESSRRDVATPGS
jgi:hypothetical protein